ncbi:MAG: aminodeoxychorismate synthase component I [Chloroflexi bacterium]|nr:aminodeoxychorismate synthase component I [Chloroflexota bacterium]
MKPIEPQIHETVLRQDGKWLYFFRPHRVIEIREPEETVSALREIEDLVNINGWHAAGFVGYEAASAFDQSLHTLARETQNAFPLLWFGLYPAPRLIDLPEPVSPQPALTWSPTADRETYNAAIEQIKSYIARGHTYQVNYTLRLRADFDTNPWPFFLHLAQTQNNHAAYIDTGRYVIASASPELFFQLDGDLITCRPMKGTVQRGRTTLEDRERAEWLRNSEKNRAENVMIVDMIRNDLGRIATVGSIRVPELFTTEKYPTLWQMTSTVRAKTSSSIAGIFKALFPCASITGAPKVSTMKIIAELETTPRKIYTGSIGHFEPQRKATFNVAIRTILLDRQTKTAEYGVGGGIVWDSTSADEYAEALLKARVLAESSPQFSLLETMLWTPEEGFFLREEHIARLLDSAEYFDFRTPGGSAVRELHPSKPPTSKDAIENYLDEICSRFTSPQRVRVLLDRNGNLSHEAGSFQPKENDPPLKVCLAKEPVHSQDAFLFHKTTHREVYENARKDFPEYDDVLLYNERGELTEFTAGNLVVELDGRLYTPPIFCGLLAGTFRARLLQTGQVEERIVHAAEIETCAKIYRVNSVRRWQKVEFK